MEIDELDSSHYTLHACTHCKGVGICISGPAGASCMVCAKRNELKKGPYHGLAWGTCGGLGKTDTKTYRMNHRTQPILSISLVFGSIGLILLFGFSGSLYFREVLIFCTTILGSVIGYYFSKNPKQN